jgi:beta-fructofuranosidase
MNDPNGLIHWQGRYHMFYQYNPRAAQWGEIHWGHADSPDLVHWTHRPIALAPLPGGADADGCWSGCAVAPPAAGRVDAGDGRVAFLYTGVLRQSDGHFNQAACLAWGSGSLETLERDPANPVIAAPPPGYLPVNFRDHTVWRVGEGWRMAIGSGDEQTGPAALLYASPDLRAWEYLGPLCEGKDVPAPDFNLGNMWECPSLFFDGGQAGLVISGCGQGGYGPTILTGAYADPRFQPRLAEKLDYGGTTFYAPQLFQDAAGRTLMFGWLMEARAVTTQLAAGWSGVMSLPRRVWIDSQGCPRYAFAPELHALRGPGLRLADEAIQPGMRDLNLRSAQVEILLELERGSAASAGLSLLRSPDGAEETRLLVDWEGGRLVIQRGQSSLVERNLPDLEAPLPLEDGRLRLHLYLDASTLECIAGERVALTGRVYPSRADSLGLGLFVAGGTAQVRRFELYQLDSAW